MKSPADSKLPPYVRYAVPVLAIVFMLVFSMLAFLPPHRSVGQPLESVPDTSTILFVPAYLVIAITMIFGGLYLFKWLMDYDPDEPTNYK